MGEDAKANLLLRYVKVFNHMGFYYFQIPMKECNTLYVCKLDLFRELLQQEIPDKKAAKEMMKKLAIAVLREHKGSIEVRVISI